MIIRLALILATALTLHGEDVIGSIDFFGYKGIDLVPVRAALPIREGDKISPESAETLRTRTEASIFKAAGFNPTGVSFVCCNAQGRWMVFIGLKNAVEP